MPFTLPDDEWPCHEQAQRRNQRYLVIVIGQVSPGQNEDIQEDCDEPDVDKAYFPIFS